MASIRRRRDKWQAQVRRLGHQCLTRTFVNRSDAVAWARQMEVALDKGAITRQDGELKRLTLGDLLQRYAQEITPNKRGAAIELIRLNALQRAKLANLTLYELTSAKLAAHRDDRLKEVASSTVRREFTILRHVMQVARRDWGIRLANNPADLVSLPPSPRARERRLSDQDLAALATGLQKARNPWIGPAVHFAVATGLRRGELLAMKWCDIDVQQRLLAVPQTKTGEPRIIPLTAAGIAVLGNLPNNGREGHVFPLSANALRIAWGRLTKRANVENLHFHDLRHEAISRFFELGLTVPEVALISGHKDPRMLFRYTHIRPAHVGKRLDDLIAAQPAN